MTSFIRIAAASVLTVASASAMAADLPPRMAPPPYVAPLPVFTWTGAYFGINGGATFDNTSKYTLTGTTTANVIDTARPGTAKSTDSGFTAGGQIGYNYQFGAGNGVVVGVEADAAYTDIDKTANILGTGNTLSSYRSQIDYLGTVRGRVGYAFNQFLIYGTGGLAYGNVTNTVDLYAPGTAGALRFSGTKDGFRTGYTYGGGVEYALPTGSFLNFLHSSAVTIKAEYLRYDLGDSTLTASPVTGTPATGSYVAKVRTEGNLARVGLNYKF